MADEVGEVQEVQHNTVKRGTSAVAWSALAIAIIALIIAGMAYNRTGANLEKEIQIQVDKGIEAAEDAVEDTTQDTTDNSTGTTPDSTTDEGTTNPDDTDTTTQP